MFVGFILCLQPVRTRDVALVYSPKYVKEKNPGPFRISRRKRQVG